MNDNELLRHWEADKPIYMAWGQHVADCITRNLLKRIGSRILDDVLKIGAKPRLKDDNALLDKALYRGKAYVDPYKEVEDKVGVRFVVLLTTDVRLIEHAIGDCGFVVSKDMDYEKERQQKPLEFTYQSDHFIVRPRDVVTLDNGITITQEVACEVQVRTLLQHAHSELTHDRIYKGQAEAPTEVQRTVAKSMALIEATDEFFEQVVTKLSELDKPTKEFIDGLSDLYRQHVKGVEPGKAKSNYIITTALTGLMSASTISAIKAMLLEKPYITQHIATEAAHRHLFRQPAVLLAYFGVCNQPAMTKKSWPLLDEELRPIFSKLGKSLNDY